MTLKRTLFRTCNAVLASFGLELQPLSRDFDARLDQPEQLRRIFIELGQIADRWFAQQTLFPIRHQFNSADALAPFYEDFLTSPFRGIGGGSRFNNLAWLYLIAKAMQPAFIVDSGTFRGASAWAFAAAGAKVYSFDIDLSRLAYRHPGVIYSQCDWTTFDWSGSALSEALIYFDDHLDQVRRLQEASQHAIPLAIFDDDFPVSAFAPMAGGGRALPKIEFVLDDQLREWQELSWIEKEKRYVFPIDRNYLDYGRSLIVHAERLPDTSQVTGIQQTPYRILRVAAKQPDKQIAGQV